MTDSSVSSAVTTVKPSGRKSNGVAGSAILAGGKIKKAPKVTTLKNGVSFKDARTSAKNRIADAKTAVKAAAAANKAAVKEFNNLVKAGEKLTKAAAAAEANFTAVPKNKDLKTAHAEAKAALKEHTKQAKALNKSLADVQKQVSRADTQLGNATKAADALEEEIKTRTTVLS